MTSGKRSQDQSDSLMRIVDEIYEVALDPERYEQLIDIWEERIAPLRSQAKSKKANGSKEPNRFDLAGILDHARRADNFLDRTDGVSAQSVLASIVKGTEPSASFAVDQDMRVRAANIAATKVFSVRNGQDISTIDLPTTVRSLLAKQLRKAFNGSSDPSPLLRYNRESDGKTVILRIRPVEIRIDASRYMLIVSNELVWPDGLETILQEAFSLTGTEVVIVRQLAEGKTAREIAGERGRSPETLKTQLKSILAKTATKNQVELVRTTLGLMDVVGATHESARHLSAHSEKPSSRSLGNNEFVTLDQPDNRKLDYLILGDPAGKPALYLPMDLGFARLTRDAEDWLNENGMCLMVPVRPGYGATSPAPDPSRHLETILDDMLAILRHRSAWGVPAICLTGDSFFAYHLARRHPGSLSAILNCGPGFPAFKPAHFERMHKWHRFILANARHAPSLLPFLARAGFSLARRIGKDRFVEAVFASSPGDLRTFSNRQVREAISLGTEITLSSDHSAHVAFAGEVLLRQMDWSDFIRTCTVPIHVWCGGEDPQAPPETIQEIMEAFPSPAYHMVPGAGQLLVFSHWKEIFSVAGKYMA